MELNRAALELSHSRAFGSRIGTEWWLGLEPTASAPAP